MEKSTTAGVPYGSILGPLLSNIFINDIFLYIENSDLCNYADDSTLFVTGESLSIIIENLKSNLLRISKWFHENFMVLNPDKCHVMVLGDLSFTCNLTCNNSWKSFRRDDKLTFTLHLGNMIKKANQKLDALNSKSLHGPWTNNLIMSYFIKSQFSYPPTNMGVLLENLHE